MRAQKTMAVRGKDLNRFRIQIFTDYGEPYCRLTTEIEGAVLAADEFILNYEHINDYDQWLEEAGYIEDTGRTVPSGFVSYPIYRLVVPVEEWDLEATGW